MSPLPPSVLVVGAGFSGICLGIELKKAGVDSFTILEKAPALGGTWRDNKYPGAACDVPSFAYCFSFLQKTDWSRKWAPQEEIYDYMRHCAEKHGLLPHMRFGTEVLSAEFDEAARLWRVRTGSGEELVARHFVTAVGQLNRPHVPDIPGLGSFRGVQFHSARWDANCDMAGKRVAVIGSAASAVQLVPEIARVAEQLYVLQRTPNWILPKNDRVLTDRETAVFARFPLFARVYRWLIWLSLELRFPVLLENPLAVWVATRIAERKLGREVRDPELRKALRPDYPIGAKRILITDDYYPALQRPNVRLVTAGVGEVTPDAIVTRSGETLPVDAIVLATGFETTAFLAPMEIRGRSGRALASAWQNGAEAYLGMTVPEFPNFFMMYGPNTNLGHNSILFMLECQARYIVRSMQKTAALGGASIEVKPDVFERYNEELEKKLAKTVWARVDRSWYKDLSGRIVNNWYGSTTAYWWRTRRVDLRHYTIVR